MKAVNIHGAGDVRVDDIATPKPGPHDVLLKIDACGICGSDLTFAKISQPWPLGHEAAGTVVAVGQAVPDMALLQTFVEAARRR